MKKFLFQLSIFLIPVFIFWLISFLLEPRNFPMMSKLFIKDNKFQNINHLYKEHIQTDIYWDLYQFQQNPCRNIIISDSKGEKINTDLIKNLSGNKYVNLFIDGCNASTKFSIFWFAASQTKLNHVVIQLDIGNWSLKSEPLFDYYPNSSTEPFLSFFYSTTLKHLKYKITHSSYANKNLIMLRNLRFPITDEKNKLLYSYLKESYKEYVYPVQYIEDLKTIVNYCQRNKIDLEFLILPSHQIFNEYLSKIGVLHYNEQFLKDITSLCKTYNYSSDLKINKNEKYFVDYFHPTQFTTDSITKLIWGNPDSISDLKQ